MFSQKKENRVINDKPKYYFCSEIWDAPEIIDAEYNVVDSLMVSKNMYSWIVIKDKVYVSYETSHYGAIEVALMSIHHLDSVEQIEKKFGEPIDDICEDIRYSKTNEAEGRFWCKYNLIECTGGELTDDYVRQICQQVGVSINKIKVVGPHIDGMNYGVYPIIKYKAGIVSENTMRKHIIQEDYDTGPKFKPTVQWMAENYAKANEELFGGELGDCIFKAEPIKSNSNWLGSFSLHGNSVTFPLKVNRHTRRMFVRRSFADWEDTYINRQNFVELCNPTITLSTYYAGTQDSLYATLVHEMCHYYTYMYGYCPKQGHGPEFRQIGRVVAYRSKGALTVQRIASAEVMTGYEVDDMIKQRQERRQANAKARADYYLIDKPEESFMRMLNTRSVDVLNSIRSWARKNNAKIYHITNPEITDDIYKNGYQSAMRKFTYWVVKKSGQIVRDVFSNDNNYELFF